MKILSPSLIIVVLLAFSCSGNVHQTPTNQEQSLAQTRTMLKEHVQGLYAGDAKAAASMYDEDIQFYGEDDAAYLSKDEVQQYYNTLYESVEFKNASYTPSEFNVINNTAIEIGNLTWAMNSKNGDTKTPTQSSHKYLLIWENDLHKGNSWTITRAMMVGLN